MNYITGDTHGDQRAWLEYVEPLLSSGDRIFIPGDCGIGRWFGPMTEDAFYDHIEQQPYTLLLIDGNHEDFDRLNAYPIESWCSGKVHRIRRNILHLMRGEIFIIDGERFFVLGGGFSRDKARQLALKTWSKQELPSQEELDHAERNLRELRAQNKPLDYIITHTAPPDAVQYLAAIPKYGISFDISKEYQLAIALKKIQAEWNVKKWYFGHYHVDRELFGDQIALSHAIRELETGHIIGYKGDPVD